MAALHIGSRYLLAAIFLMAAITKITDLQRFEDQVLLHAGVPYWLGLGIVILVPWFEFTCGLCLALGYAVREAALLLSVLLFALSCYSFAHLGEPDCRCYFFPAVLPTSPWWPPIRNGLLLCCAVALTLSRPFGRMGSGMRERAD